MLTDDQVADLALLDDHINHLLDLIPKDRSAFDIQRLFFLLTLDSATHFLFGESVGCMLPPSETTGVLEKCEVGSAQGFAEAFTTAQDYLAARARAQGLYWLINPKEFRDANRRVHEVVDHYVGIALDSKRHPEKKDQSGRYIFLDALAADTDDPKVLRDNMLNILLAGRDTTASLLSSTFFYLSRHPHAWARLRREIVAEFGDSRNPREITQGKLKDIPYLRYVLNEGKRRRSQPLMSIISNRVTQFSVSNPPSPPISVSRPRTLRSRSEVVPIADRPCMCRRARLSRTMSSPCTAAPTSGARMRSRSDRSGGRRMGSMDGSICLSTVVLGSVLAVSITLTL